MDDSSSSTSTLKSTTTLIQHMEFGVPKSSLLSLPNEIRIMIYNYFLRLFLNKGDTSPVFRCGYHNETLSGLRTWNFTTSSSLLPLMCSCKVISAEFLNYTWSQSSLRINAYPGVNIGKLCLELKRIDAKVSQISKMDLYICRYIHKSLEGLANIDAMRSEAERDWGHICPVITDILHWNQAEINWNLGHGDFQLPLEAHANANGTSDQPRFFAEEAKIERGAVYTGSGLDFQLNYDEKAKAWSGELKWKRQ